MAFGILIFLNLNFSAVSYFVLGHGTARRIGAAELGAYQAGS